MTENDLGGRGFPFRHVVILLVAAPNSDLHPTSPVLSNVFLLLHHPFSIPLNAPRGTRGTSQHLIVVSAGLDAVVTQFKTFRKSHRA